jgi:hypothetical protein
VNHVRDRITQKAREESEREYKKYANIMKADLSKQFKEEDIKHTVGPISSTNNLTFRKTEYLHYQTKGSYKPDSVFTTEYIEDWICNDPTYNKLEGKKQLEQWDFIECREVENSYWMGRDVPTLGSPDYFMQAWNTGVRHMHCTKEGGCVGINHLELWDHAECRSMEDSYWEEKTLPPKKTQDYEAQIWKSEARHIFCDEGKGCVELEGTVGRLRETMSTLKSSMEMESRNFRSYLDLRQQRENAKLRKAMDKKNN